MAGIGATTATADKQLATTFMEIASFDDVYAFLRRRFSPRSTSPQRATASHCRRAMLVNAMNERRILVGRCGCCSSVASAATVWIERRRGRAAAAGGG